MQIFTAQPHPPTRKTPPQLLLTIQNQHIDTLKEDKHILAVRLIFGDRPGVAHYRLQSTYQGERVLTAYRIRMDCPEGCGYVDYRQEFELSRLGREELSPDRTTPELLNIVGCIAGYLKTHNSPLTVLLGGSGRVRLQYKAMVLLGEDEESNVGVVVGEMTEVVGGFMRVYARMSEEEGRQGRSRGEGLGVGVGVLGGWREGEGRGRVEMERRRMRREIEKREQQLEKENICDGMEIIEKLPVQTSHLLQFSQNLRKNKALRKPGDLSITRLHFHLYPTMSVHCPDYSPSTYGPLLTLPPSTPSRTETVIKKICFSPISHQNQLDFLVLHQNYKSSHIAKYFLQANRYLKDRTLVDIYSRYEGGDLYTDMVYPGRRGREFGLEQYLGVFLQLAKAGEFLGERRVCHRDVKAANVLVGRRGGRRVIRVVDFGSWIAQPAADRRQPPAEQERQIDPLENEKKRRMDEVMHLLYERAVEMDPDLKGEMSEEMYNTHANYDMYGIGATMSELMTQTSMPHYPTEDLIRRCRNPNPQRRPSPKELSNEIIELLINHSLCSQIFPPPHPKA